MMLTQDDARYAIQQGVRNAECRMTFVEFKVDGSLRFAAHERGKQSAKRVIADWEKLHSYDLADTVETFCKIMCPTMRARYGKRTLEEIRMAGFGII